MRFTDPADQLRRIASTAVNNFQFRAILVQMLTPETIDVCTCQTAQLAKPLGALHSPVAELLNTSAAPSLAECAVVHEIISQLAGDISKLDREIEQVEEILARLRHNRAALHRFSNGHRNALNITRRLPIEILGEIFIQLQNMLGGRSIAPTQVCRQWREVAIATSKLWNHLDIQYTGSRALVNAEMTPIWFQRSGGQPLIIVVRSHPMLYEDSGGENSVLDAMIHNTSHRWKEVTLVVSKAMQPFLNNIPEHLPMLHSLTIDADRSHRVNFGLVGPDTGITTLNNFRHAAALHVLTLERRIILQIPEFPWAQLTACTLLNGGLYTCTEGYFVLSQAVNLQVYKMEVDGTFRLSPSLPTNIHHANLRHLEIVIFAGPYPGDLLNLLTLPALIELKIQVLGFHTDYTPEPLTSLITRSGCSLIRLSLGPIGDSAFTRDQLFPLFIETPKLTELEVQGHVETCEDDDLMDLLTHFPNHDASPCCLLPQLVRIKLSVHQAFSYEKFAALLASRRQGNDNFSPGGWARGGLAKICTAVLMPWADTTASGRHARYLPEETYQEFITLRNSGLDFYVQETSRSSLESYFLPGEEKVNEWYIHDVADPTYDSDEVGPW